MGNNNIVNDMKNMISKAVWLSFDLGIGGDYPGLYKWLDNHEALECGDSVAFFNYDIESSEIKNLVRIIKEDITKNVNLRAGDRLYMIRREGSLIKGNFLAGKRKGNPWEGYGEGEVTTSESGE